MSSQQLVMMPVGEITELDEDEQQMLRHPVEVEQKILGKEQLIMKLQKADSERHAVLEEDTVAFANGLHVHRVAIEHARDSLRNRVKGVHAETEEALYRQRTDRHLTETKMERFADAYAAEAHGRLEEDRQLQEQSNCYTREVQAEICQLHNDLAQARGFRLEKGKRLAEGVSSKLEEVREAIAAEKRIREESVSTLLELFGQMGQRLEQELETARNERHAATERVVSVMEDASDLLHKAQRAGAKKCRDHIEVTSEAKRMASSAAELSKTRHAMQKGKSMKFVQDLALERLR